MNQLLQSHGIAFFLCLLLQFTHNYSLISQTTYENSSELADVDIESVNTSFQDDIPTDINTCTLEELTLHGLVDLTTANAILNHRKTYGAFASIYELQVIRSISRENLQRLIATMTCSEPAQVAPDPFDQSISKGMISIRTRLPLASDSLDRYPGNQASVSLRFMYHVKQNLIVGLMLEKDAGEPFLWRGSHHQSALQRISGFDNTRITLDWHRPFSRIDRLLVGKYRLGLGQGLLVWQGFPLSKGASSMQIQKPESPIKPVFSPSESQNFNGVAFSSRPFSKTSITGFLSYNGQDAVIYTDTVSQSDQPFSYFSALDTDGYHRTESEKQSRNALDVGQAGGKIQFEAKKVTFSCNLLHSWFSLPMIRTPALYRKHLFEGNTLTQLSVDYRGSWRQFAFFGEHARSFNGGMAHLAGFQASLHRKFDLGVQVRSFGRNYQTLSGSTLSESSLPINETGLYTGIEWRVWKGFVINAYSDSWCHPWLGYQRSAPAYGRDVLLRFLWRKKRWGEVYMQWKKETKYADAASSPIPELHPEVTQRLRLHAQIALAPGWQWRCRAEWSAFQGSQKQHGFLMFHDLIIKPMAEDWSVKARVAWIDVDGFESRIYSYEHDVLFTSSIPFIQGQGTRFYILARKKWGNLGQTEIRWSSDVRKLSAEDAWERNRAESGTHQLSFQYTIRF